MYILIYLLTAIGLSPGGRTHLHTNNTQNNTNNNRTTQITTNVEECGPCLVFASFTLAFTLQLRKKARKTLSQGKKNISPIVSTEFCAKLYILHYVSRCFALVFWRNVLYYLSIRHLIYLLCNIWINVTVQSSLGHSWIHRPVIYPVSL